MEILIVNQIREQFQIIKILWLLGTTIFLKESGGILLINNIETIINKIGATIWLLF